MKEANLRGDLDTVRRVLAARQAAGLPLDHRTTSAAITGACTPAGWLACLPTSLALCGWNLSLRVGRAAG